MVIFIGLCIAGFGYMMYKLYRGYMFHHSIGIPIIILGLIIAIGGVGYKIIEKRTQDILNISPQEIHKITIDYIYHPQDSLKEFYNVKMDNLEEINQFLEKIKNGNKCEYERFSTKWYMNIIFKMKSGKCLYGQITKTTYGFMFDQTIKFGFIPVNSENYYCIENIIPIMKANIK